MEYDFTFVEAIHSGLLAKSIEILIKFILFEEFHILKVMIRWETMGVLLSCALKIEQLL